MDVSKALILLDDKPSTKLIETIEYNYKSGTYKVIFYCNNKRYNYPLYRVEIINKYQIIDLNKIKIVLLDNREQKNISKILMFTSAKNLIYYRIVLNDNFFFEVTESEIKFIAKDQLSNLEYITKLAEISSLTTETGEKILLKELLKIDVTKLSPVLSNYLGLSNDIKLNTNQNFLIFPFGCNSSQYLAVKNAINNTTSVIEGPPGTGKTQTILNIIANLLINDKNCQVVSNNNYAIANIAEKLNKYNLGYLSAVLGKSENIKNFINSQTTQNHNFPKGSANLKIATEKLQVLKDRIYKMQTNVLNVYKCQDECASLHQKLSALKKEYHYFTNQFSNILSNSKPILRYQKTFLQKLYFELSDTKKISIFQKLKYIYYYKIGDFSFYNQPINQILTVIQDKIYLTSIEETKNLIIKNQLNIDFYSKEEKQYIDFSLEYLNNYLMIKNNDNYRFDKKELKNAPLKFIKNYPVVLSTTYSSKNTFSNNFTFDYVIMDEASQVDIVSGTLSLSSAKNAVIIGDDKQLPNVVTNELASSANNLFSQYQLPEYYNYTQNSFLQSFKKAIKNAPVTLLKQHYRCHPLIIDFCNKEFYNNELIIMSKDNGENSPIEIIRTVKGNHNRGLSNQRQADIITNIVKKIPSSKYQDIGIIAPYNEQVDLLKKQIPGVDISTIHKFQGREKDVIIISTVDDNLNSFITDEKILNVAISRAKKKLIIVITGNDITNKYINDLISYTKYQNMNIEESKLASVFDILYKQNEKYLLEYRKSHKQVSQYDTENIIYNLITTILKDYQNINFLMHYPLSSLIRNFNFLTEDERKYATNHQTHLDFLLYNPVSKKPLLAIEVDGYQYHHQNTTQYQRDLLKNSILSKLGVPLLRLNTTGNNEEEKIRTRLNSIV